MTEADQIKFEALSLLECLKEPHRKIVSTLEDDQRLRVVCYHMKDRLKRPNRIVEKVLERRRAGRPEYSVDHITDACGFRLIALFQSDVAAALRQLLHYVGDHADALFPTVREIRFYGSRPVSDPLSIELEVEKVVDECDLRQIYARETKASLYSSVHIVMDLNVADDNGVSRVVGIEFQVRSAFEEVWGEIDHKLRYGPNRGAIDSTSWDKHLNALKALTDGLIQYVEVIRGQAMAGADSGAPSNDTKPIETTDTVLSRLARIRGMPNAFAERLREAFKVRDTAKTLVKGAERIPHFKDGIKRFRMLLDEVEGGTSWMHAASRADVQELRYWLRLELAFCLMHGDGGGEESRQNLDEADQIYAGIEQELATDAVSRFRRAQVLRRKNRFGDSVDRYRAALAVIDSDPRIDQDHWIHAALHRHLGFALYMVAVEERKEPETNLKLAIECTSKALTMPMDVRDRQLCLNNLAYYCWEARERGYSDINIDEDDFRRHVADLRALVDQDPPFQAHTSYDTLCRCYNSLGERADAVAMAQRSRAILQEAVCARAGVPEDTPPLRITGYAHTYLSADEMDAWLYAMEVLAPPVSPLVPSNPNHR